MFKKGIISDEISQDFGRVVEVSREFNLDSIEIRSVWDKPPQNLDPSEVKRIKEMIKDSGLVISCIASPFFKCDLDNDEEYKVHLEVLRRCIQLAHELGTNIIRGFTFWRKEGREKVWVKILEKFKEPVKILEKEGVIMGIENETSTFGGTVKEVGEFVDVLNSPYVKVIWDPGNEVFARYELEGESPFPQGYNRIKGRMIHMHLKDARRDKTTGKIECVPIGEGEVDCRGQFQELLHEGYGGHVSLETHWRPKKKLSEELLNRPGGSSFSEMGEEASRVCLRKWMEILEGLA